MVYKYLWWATDAPPKAQMWPACPCISPPTCLQSTKHTHVHTHLFVPLGVSLHACHLWSFCDRSWSQLRAPDDLGSSPKVSKLRSDTHFTHVPCSHILPLQRRSACSALDLLYQRLAPVTIRKHVLAKDKRERIEKLWKKTVQRLPTRPVSVPWTPIF